MPIFELVYVSGGRHRQNRALAKELQRVPSAQRYYLYQTSAEFALRSGLKPLKHRFFSTSIELLFKLRPNEDMIKNSRETALGTEFCVAINLVILLMNIYHHTEISSLLFLGG